MFRFFGNTCAVNDMSFEVAAGEVFGYIGPNGAGKTTSMRILATLDVPSMGDAYVDGFSVVNDPDRVRKRLGFMPDAYGTYPNVNCEEYLDFFARSYGLVGRERTRAMRHVMSFTHLDRLAQKPINGLSKGMKQRLCLGRALIHDPKVLILDEPAAGLDPRARIELRDMIGEIAANGKACLISSHILTELAEMCHRVAILEQGKLLATGSVNEIMSGLDQRDASAHVAAGRKPSVKTFLRVLDDQTRAIAWLKQHPEIDEVTLDADQIVFMYDKEPQAQADLLKAMIQAGLNVCSFTMKQRTLEEAFLHVTKGRIQ
jgi:ABC-2 type transport system ATP-binding protein